MSVNCEKYEIYSAGLVDGELSFEDKKELFLHLAECSSCMKKYDEQQAVKEETMKLRNSLSLNMDSERYWAKLFNRVERSFSWILIASGAIILFIYAVYQSFFSFWINPDISLFIKIGTAFLVIGLFSLLLSVLREKLFIRKTDKYKEIQL